MSSKILAPELHKRVIFTKTGGIDIVIGHKNVFDLICLNGINIFPWCNVFCKEGAWTDIRNILLLNANLMSFFSYWKPEIHSWLTYPQPPSFAYMRQGTGSALFHYRNQCCLIVNRTLRNKLKRIWSKIYFSFVKMHMKISPLKRQPFYSGEDY